MFFQNSKKSTKNLNFHIIFWFCARDALPRGLLASWPLRVGGTRRMASSIKICGKNSWDIAGQAKDVPYTNVCNGPTVGAWDHSPKGLTKVRKQVKLEKNEK